MKFLSVLLLLVSSSSAFAEQSRIFPGDLLLEKFHTGGFISPERSHRLCRIYGGFVVITWGGRLGQRIPHLTYNAEIPNAAVLEADLRAARHGSFVTGRGALPDVGTTVYTDRFHANILLERDAFPRSTLNNSIAARALKRFTDLNCQE
jgi:hypothetical protein